MTSLAYGENEPVTPKHYPATPRVRSFANLDSDDFRHPFDQQTTAMLRSLPGLEIIARAVLVRLISRITYTRPHST